MKLTAPKSKFDKLDKLRRKWFSDSINSIDEFSGLKMFIGNYIVFSIAASKVCL